MAGHESLRAVPKGNPTLGKGWVFIYVTPLGMIGLNIEEVFIML